MTPAAVTAYLFAQRHRSNSYSIKLRALRESIRRHDAGARWHSLWATIPGPGIEWCWVGCLE